MKKYRLSAVALVVILLLSAVAPQSRAALVSFSDAGEEDWFYSFVTRAAEKGIMIGTGDGRFSPDDSLTRAEAVTVLSRMTEQTVKGRFSECEFLDVSSDEYYADPVGWACGEGIAFGSGDGYFDPDAPVTRRDFAAFLYRFAENGELYPVSAVETTQFSDTELDWGGAEIEALHSAGVLLGDGSGRFYPDRELTRAQTAAAIVRFLDLYAAEPYLLDPTPDNIGVGVYDEESGLEFSYVRLFEEDGVAIPAAGGVGAHGGHETRIVRTPYGTYAAYITEATGAATAEHPLWHQGVATFSVIKITSEGFHVLFRSEYPQASGSCTPNVLYGENGKVYATVICDNKDRYMSSMGTSDFRNGVWLEVFEIDTKTDEVSRPSSPMLIDHETSPFDDHGYGYTQPILDNKNGKLYALTCGGEGEEGYLAWFIYDLESRTWDPECYTVTVDTRRCYINGYPDGEGGFTFVIERCAQRGRLASNLGLDFGGGSDSYVWDALYLYHIPDPTKEEYVEVPVLVPDYEAEGPRSDGRYYFDNAAHYGVNGCTCLDTEGRLHVIFTHGITATRKSTVYHAVYDLSGNELYYEPIPTSLLPKNGTNNLQSCGFAMTQGDDGTYYVFFMPKNKSATAIEVWSSPADDGENFTKIMDARELVFEDGTPVPPCEKPIIANSRNHSVLDGTTAIMFHRSGGANGGDAYYYVAVKLP